MSSGRASAGDGYRSSAGRALCDPQSGWDVADDFEYVDPVHTMTWGSHYGAPLCGGVDGKTSGAGTWQPSGKGMGPRLGKSGMRHQTVHVYQTVPGDDTAGTHQ